MSIYVTLLDFSPDEEHGLGQPFDFFGSHVLPVESGLRSGWLEVASIPAFCGPDPSKLVDFLRVDMGEYDDGDPTITKLLNRPQVEALRDTLTDWLNREVEVG